MITGTNLTIEIGQRTLVREASFLIGTGEKVGIVGRNGTGKSTLISVLVNEPDPEVQHRGDLKIVGTLGFLPQVPSPKGLGLDASGFSHVLSARGLDVLDDQLGAARKAMSEDPSSENIELFSSLEEQYRELGGYEAEATMARLADGVGLRQDLLFEDIETLSGGQRRRVDIVRLLFHGPEIMILDEPTNHLDLSAKRWLMDELSAFNGTMLVISHDLDLLDKAIDKVLHLSDARLTEYKGNYTTFMGRLEVDQAQRAKASAMEEKEIKRLSSLADSMRGQTEKRAKTAKALDRRVDRIQSNRTEVHRVEKKVRLRLPTPIRSGETPLEVSSIKVAYGPKVILKGIRLHAGRGDRIAVVGKNGAGKSSLLRCLAGVQEPSSGKVHLGPNVHLGYFAQEHEQIDLDASSLDNVDDSVLTQEAERRALLGSFGLSGAAMEQPAGSLSGGERAKLGLAMLSAGRSNLLILDEPTNNLDPASVEAVGRMFSVWEGTIVVVSHEPAFVEALDPTHCLRLPDERFDLWRDEDIDVVAMR
ncbi:MAG: ABC-F family ATP-binding cassette domain-containing protein [Actinomycetes bacterium]